jgi:hypothetical protein
MKLLALVVIACAATTIMLPLRAAEETVGERFRKVIADIDAQCKRDKMGPYLDRNDPEYRKKVGLTNCDVLLLKPRDWRTEKMVKTEGQSFPIPERWIFTSEGRFAHSIKLPPPHDKPKRLYRIGMSANEYFEGLCKEEAGDFIFKVVEGVEGVARLRAPEIATDDLLRHLFATEGTTGMSLWHVTSQADDIGRVLVQPNHGKYTFAESPAFPKTFKKDGFPFRRFARDPSRASGSAINYKSDGSTFSVPNLVVETGTDRIRANYGFTWRGVVRPNDRELGIAGGELLILNLETGEVLGLRRVFRKTVVGQRGVWWLSAANCSPELAILPARFIYRVLKPTE